MKPQEPFFVFEAWRCIERLLVYSERPADQLRSALQAVEGVTEKRLFGGLAFLAYGTLCCGVIGDAILVRIGPDRYDAALQDPSMRPMDFMGRVRQIFVNVDLDAVPTDEVFHGVVTRAVDYASSLPRKR